MVRRSYRNRRLAAVLVGLVACSSGGGGGGGTSPPASDPPAGSATQASITALAASLHDGLAAGRDVTTDVADLFRWMGVPVLGEADGALVDAHIAAGTFFALEAQVGVIAGALAEGATFELPGVVAALSSAGFGAMPAGPLTVQYLSTLLTPMATAATLASEDQVLALLTTLGRERARRTPGGITDPLWGDGRLDMLQFALLDYLTSSPPPGAVLARAGVSAADPARARVLAVDPLTALKLVRANLRMAQGLYRFAVGARAAWQGVCEQLFRAGLRLTTALSPGAIAKPDSPPPNQATASAVATFQATAGVRAGANVGHCTLPPSGALGQAVPISWSIDTALAPHVSIQNADPATLGNGVATATIAASQDLSPRVLRQSGYRTVAGSVFARGTVTSARYTSLPIVVPSQREGSSLVVSYYDPPPHLLASFSVEMHATGVWESETQWHPADDLVTEWRASNVELALDAEAGMYHASLAYTGAGAAVGQEWSLTRTYTGTCTTFAGETIAPPGFQVFAFPGADDLVMTFALVQPVERWDERSIGIGGGGVITCGEPHRVVSPGSLMMTNWGINHFVSGQTWAGLGVTGLVADPEVPKTFVRRIDADVQPTGDTTHERSSFTIVNPF